MPLENYQETKLFSLLNSGSAIVILDNDGTIFSSQPSEAWRIRTILEAYELDENLPYENEILTMLNGKNLWDEKLYKEIKDKFPKISEVSIDLLKARMQLDEADAITVMMGQHMIPLPGSQHLYDIKKMGNVIAICSDNYSDTVAEAINFHISGIHCLPPDNRPYHEAASKTKANPHDFTITLNDSMGVNLKDIYKPNPTKLLIQQFKALCDLGITDLKQLQEFINNPAFRMGIKLHPNYRPTIYIGDDVNDYKAALNAHFDYFVGVTTTGKHNEEKFRSEISMDNQLKVILVNNLEMLWNMLPTDKFASKLGLFAVNQTSNEVKQCSSSMFFN